MTIELVIKATLALVVALLFVAAARRSRASLRHAMLTALFATLLLLPVVGALMPARQMEVPETVATSLRTAQPATNPGDGEAERSEELSSRPDSSLTLGMTLRILWLSGFTFLVISLVAGIWRLRYWARTGEVWLDGTRLAVDVACANDIRRAVLVVLSTHVTAPMTFGFRRQTIVLPVAARNWADEELRRALRHELEHVRRDDWAVQLLGRVTLAVYWPHPLVWVAWRRFVLEAERACDDAVVRSFEASSYATQLVALARRITSDRSVPALAMASPSKLAERITAILDTRQRRGPHSRLASVMTTAMVAALLLTVGPLRLVAGETRQDEMEESEAEIYHDVVVQAAEQGRIRILARLIEDGLDVNTSFDGDGTPLLIAARAGQMETVNWLLARGADPNVPTPGDGNPLIAASRAGETEIVRLLLDRGAKIDEIVPEDENALITASAAGHEDVVRLLIDRGANVNARAWANGREWRTPLNMTRRHGHTSIEGILRSAGARD